VGRLESGMRVSASFQIIPRPRPPRESVRVRIRTPLSRRGSVRVRTPSRGEGVTSVGYFR